MERFFTPDLQQDSEKVLLSAEESRHLTKAYRKRPGDDFLAINGKGLQATCRFEKIVGQQTQAKVVDISITNRPAGAKICIALSTLRPKRLDWAVEKLSELGIGTIQLLTTRHTSVETFKQTHLKKIAVSALKQSQNTWLPQILPPAALKTWLPKVSNKSNCYIAHCLTDTEIEPASHFSQPLTIIVGPEGGFHIEEIEQAIALGCQFIDLGHSILRSETAAICAAAIVLSHFRNA